MNFVALLARSSGRFTKIIKIHMLVARVWGSSAKRKCPDTPADDETAQDEAQLRRDLWRRDRMFLAVGSQPSISRRHADIVYDFRKRRWVLLCLGRNGVFVDSVLVKQGDVPVTLNNKATIERKYEKTKLRRQDRGNQPTLISYQ